MTESIAPGAFTRTLADGHDILALVDHDARRVLGRTRSGTLTLREDDKGLAFDLAVPDTQAGRDILVQAERGDLGGMSFGFFADDEAVEGNHRNLRSVQLVEVSVVAAFPAYEGTEVLARSRASAKPALDYGSRVIRLAEAMQ